MNDTVRALVDGKNYPVLSTVNPDGGPQSSVMWIGRDGDDLLFCTVAGRRKERNLRRDPRVSITVFDLADPLNYAEIRGTATMTTEDALKLDDELSWKYDGKPKDPDPAGFVRVVVRVTPTKVTGYAA
ncbi:PPOX class F420-dependent oxidoreductase [Fodinicola feengrottensis]|uniref:PPOX class F420-dependent oxidoreductase n=1 Tax=Fodinicola feengrottensis TaxID=435914 RepID=A0ABN2H4X1_9ACTN|nr:PPOX class F420-dependent oxidoreductase [Fodinicola feengrottensis]